MEKNISVLMSVYKNDVPKNVRIAVESMVNQTLKPKQIVMVVDGPVPDDLKAELEQLEKDYDIYENIWLPENLGTGGALENTWQKCKYEYIAKMDSDDISVPDRLEKEMAYLEEHPDVDVIGANSLEFYNETNKLSGIKILPAEHEKIIKLLKTRCPMCHPSMIMKRSIVEKAGGYKPWMYAEDWYLIIRMYMAGAKFYNLQENLLKVRITQKTYGRRSGLKHYKSIKNLLTFMYKEKIIGFWGYTKTKFVRFVGHVLVPRKLKNKLYRKYVRG